MWIKPLEISNNPIWRDKNQNKTYKELLNDEGALLKEKDGQKAGTNLTWWTETQIKARIKEDRIKEEDLS